MNFETISQNCLALIIDRFEEIAAPSLGRRQRQVIKGAIRNVLEAHAADGDLAVGNTAAPRLLEALALGIAYAENHQPHLCDDSGWAQHDAFLVAARAALQAAGEEK